MVDRVHCLNTDMHWFNLIWLLQSIYLPISATSCWLQGVRLSYSQSLHWTHKWCTKAGVLSSAGDHQSLYLAGLHVTPDQHSCTDKHTGHQCIFGALSCLSNLFLSGFISCLRVECCLVYRSRSGLMLPKPWPSFSAWDWPQPRTRVSNPAVPHRLWKCWKGIGKICCSMQSMQQSLGRDLQALRFLTLGTMATQNVICLHRQLYCKAPWLFSPLPSFVFQGTRLSCVFGSILAIRPHLKFTSTLVEQPRWTRVSVIVALFFIWFR